MAAEPGEGFVFKGGPIRTLAKNGGPGVVEALAVRDGRVLACGTLSDVRSAASPGMKEVDLAGGCVLPGFIDAHHHFILGAILADRPACRRGAIRHAGDVVQLLREHASKVRPGRWLVAVGLDPGSTREDSFPTMQDLDRVSMVRPVAVLGFTLHEAAVNQAGLERLGGPAAWASRPKDVVRRRDGAATGEIRDYPVATLLAELVRREIEDDESRCIESLRAYSDRLAKVGITHVVDPGLGPVEEALLAKAKEAGALSIGVTAMLAGDRGLYLPPDSRLERDAAGAQLKIFVDGGAQPAMSFSQAEILRFTLGLPRRALRDRSLRLLRRALRENVPAGPDGRFHSGILNYSPDSLVAVCKKARTKGYALALHAQGNEAIEMSLRALALVSSMPRPAVPDQIIHFTFPAREHVQRAADLGAAVVVQPRLLASNSEGIRDSMPPGDFLFGAPLADLLRSGALVVGSSDAPIGDFDPLEAISICRSISTEQALRLYTTNAARAVGAAELGSLVPGSRADLVRLRRDPLAAGPESAAGCGVEATFVGAREVWRRGAA